MEPAETESDSYEIIPTNSPDGYSISTIKIGSVGSQVAVGGISGWCIGHICKRVGLLAGTTLGGGLIAIKIASDRGYIKINWNRVNTDIQRATDKLKEAASNSSNQDVTSSQAIAEMRLKVQRFIKCNAVLTASFGAGILLGIAY